ncbi:MAG: hypothetical protein IPL55_12235 [Saprospiraceae bacterium]|jgi:hypothetical protein|nr:hypothetical protein [Saprospiraceae bacterium]
MKQMFLFLLVLFFFTSCEKELIEENSFKILERELIEQISFNDNPRVFVNFIKIHKIQEKAVFEKLAEIYTIHTVEKAKKIEKEFSKYYHLETRGTPCFGAYHTRTRINTVELAGCIIFSGGFGTWDCYEDYVEDQEQAMADFEECIEETYP